MTTHSLTALRLTDSKDVPFWYSLAPLQKRPGLQLLMHKEAYARALSSHSPAINTSHFQTSLHGYWIQVDLLFKARVVQEQQRALAYLLNSLFSTKRELTKPDRCQLAACSFLGSMHIPQGYLMAACISHEMKLLLRSPNVGEAMTRATQIMKDAARSLQLPVVAKCCLSHVSEGFLSFAVQDLSGASFATDYRDKDDFNEEAGYKMDSGNIDCPGLQLVFLAGLAAVIQWGEQQTQAS